MKRSLLIPFTGLFSLIVHAQLQPIDVAKNTLKVNGFAEQTLYYGFAEGDKLIFNFEEVNGKELKEFEIVELPSSSKFMDYKTRKIENKRINITRTGIYKFRFANSATGERVCRFKIQRIPANKAAKDFNTSVSSKTVYDTTYTPANENYLVSSDTAVVNVVDQISKISSKNSSNGNSNITVVDFDLPRGTISWSYYIGVGSEGKEAYNKATENFLTASATSISKIPGYGAMAALALRGLNYFSKTQGRDNVKYWFITDWNNVLFFKTGNSFLEYKQGDVINDAYQMKSPLNGRIYLGLLNDNIKEPIEVTLKVTAVTVKQVWNTGTTQKMIITTRQQLTLNN